MSEVLIKNGRVLIIKNNDVIIEERDILIENDKIKKIDKSIENGEAYIINAKNKVIMPGLINAHSHVPMSIFRETTEGCSLYEWLNKKIWPKENELTEQDIYWASMLSFMEMIRTGCTCINDQYFMSEQIRKAAEESKIRLVLTRTITSTSGEEGTDKRIEEFEKLYETRNKEDDLITYTVAPHSFYTCSDECLEKVSKLALKYNLPVHVHFLESIDEIEDIKKYLGNYKYKYLYNNKCAKPGIVNTLAYTPYGGLVLKTTSVYYKGNGNIEITGQIGNVMKESTTIALSYIKENSEIFNIDYSLFTNDFHIHFEEGSIPKDGPSAGVSIVTSLISTLKKMTIPNTVSMTGEITLRGKILPVGGLKEKLITATISNIKTVYVPLDNKEEVMEIDKSITSKLKIKYVDDYIEIYNDLFQEK